MARAVAGWILTITLSPTVAAQEDPEAPDTGLDVTSSWSSDPGWDAPPAMSREVLRGLFSEVALIGELEGFDVAVPPLVMVHDHFLPSLSGPEDRLLPALTVIDHEGAARLVTMLSYTDHGTDLSALDTLSPEDLDALAERIQ